LEPSTKSWAPQIVDEENPECKTAEAAEGTKKPKWAPEYDEKNPKKGKEEHETKEKESSKKKGKDLGAKSRSMARSPG